MNGVFVDLEDKAAFTKFVLGQENKQKSLVLGWFPNCKTSVDNERIEYAHGEYCQDVSKFSVLLHSKNPDHYKRAGALLHALYQADIITGVELGDGVYGTADDLESGFTMVSYGDAKHILTFVEFFREYHNQILAFEISYRCCAKYEGIPVTYDFDYLHNVCRYLKANTNLNVDSCFMLFKSLMRK